MAVECPGYRNTLADFLGRGVEAIAQRARNESACHADRLEHRDTAAQQDAERAIEACQPVHQQVARNSRQGFGPQPEAGAQAALSQGQGDCRHRRGQTGQQGALMGVHELAPMQQQL